jgi:hypothetical protein
MSLAIEGGKSEDGNWKMGRAESPAVFDFPVIPFPVSVLSLLISSLHQGELDAAQHGLDALGADAHAVA